MVLPFYWDARHTIDQVRGFSVISSAWPAPDSDFEVCTLHAWRSATGGPRALCSTVVMVTLTSKQGDLPSQAASTGHSRSRPESNAGANMMATNLSGSRPWPGSPDASFNTSLVLADDPGQWTHSIEHWAFQDAVDEGFVDSTPVWFDPADQGIDSEGWLGFGLERTETRIREPTSSRSSVEELSFEAIGAAKTTSAPEHSGSQSPYSTSTESSPWIITTPPSTENSTASDSIDWADRFREDGVLEVDDMAESGPALDIAALRRADPASSPPGPALGPSRVWTLPPVGLAC